MENIATMLTGMLKAAEAFKGFQLPASESFPAKSLTTKRIFQLQAILPGDEWRRKIITGFSRSPRLSKGAIVSLEPPSPIPQVIMFQYNPDSLTRTLEPQTSQGGGDTETFRLKGTPVETITLDIELDSTDQLENPNLNATATIMGIHPQLAALEMILFPKVSGVIANAALMAIGSIEITSPEGPFTLFIWGPNRVLPVRLTRFQVEEQAYDTNLNPIRAKVSLTLKVLSYADLKPTHPGYAVFMAHHTAKEVMAAIGSVTSIAGTRTT